MHGHMNVEYVFSLQMSPADSIRFSADTVQTLRKKQKSLAPIRNRNAISLVVNNVFMVRDRGGGRQCGSTRGSRDPKILTKVRIVTQLTYILA